MADKRNLPPLSTVTWLFRSKDAFVDLPHVVHNVSLYFDSSVDLPLHRACKFGSIKLLDRLWSASENITNGTANITKWTPRKYLRTDPHYRQYQFTKSLFMAMDLNDIDVVKWLASKFPGYSVRADVVERAAANGCKEILQFFQENDVSLLDPALTHSGLGLRVDWTGKILASAVRQGRKTTVWWLYSNIDDCSMTGVLEAAVSIGDIITAEWFLARDAEWSNADRYCHIAHSAAAGGDLDVLKWLDGREPLNDICGMVVKAAENGHLDVVRWLLDRDVRLNGEDDSMGAGELTGIGGEAGLAIHSAAVRGHLQVAKYLRARSRIPENDVERRLETVKQRRKLQELYRQIGPWLPVTTVCGKTMTEAAKNGFLKVVQWLYTEYGDDLMINLFDDVKEQRQQRSTKTLAMNAAARNGHLDVLQYLHGIQVSIGTSTNTGKRKRDEPKLPRCTSAAMDGAASQGHLKVVRWLHANREESCSTDAMDGAAAHGHLDVVKWLSRNRSEGCTEQAMNDAAGNGFLEVLKWLSTNRSEGCTADAMDKAAASGHLVIVKWLHDNTSAGCTTEAMDRAAMCGHLEVVKWLHFHRTEGCTTAAMDGATENAALDVIKFLHRNRTEGCTKEAMDSAAREGYFKILQWLSSHRPEGCTSAAFDSAAVGGQFEELLYLHFKYGEQCTPDAATETINNGTPNIHAWILENYPSFRRML